LWRGLSVATAGFSGYSAGLVPHFCLHCSLDLLL
jgi:hypothetical protein